MRKAEPLSIPITPKGEADGGMATHRLVVIIVLAVTVLLWLTSPWHELSAAAVSAVPLVALTLSGILKGEDVRAMGWDTLILVAGGLSLGIGLQQSGLLDLYAGRIASLSVSPVGLYFLLAYATMLFSNILSNTATCTVLIPLGMAILPGNKLEVAMIIGLASSTALFLPVSTPPNAIAFSTGMIEQKRSEDRRLVNWIVGPSHDRHVGVTDYPVVHPRALYRNKKVHFADQSFDWLFVASPAKSFIVIIMRNFLSPIQ